MTRKTWLSISNVYISPIGNVGFLTEMRTDTISTNGIVAGDFNGHSEVWDDQVKGDKRDEDVLAWATEFNMTILNNGSPTRSDPSTRSPGSPDVSLADSRWASKCEWELESV